MASQEEDEDYVQVFATLDEAKLIHLKSLFKDNCLQDEILSMMTSEEELRRALTKEIQPSLRYGEGFKFSRLWFRRKESTDTKDEVVHNQPHLLAHRSSNDSVQSPTSGRSSAAASPECVFEAPEVTERRQFQSEIFTNLSGHNTGDNGMAREGKRKMQDLEPPEDHFPYMKDEVSLFTTDEERIKSASVLDLDEAGNISTDTTDDIKQFVSPASKDIPICNQRSDTAGRTAVGTEDIHTIPKTEHDVGAEILPSSDTNNNLPDISNNEEDGNRTSSVRDQDDIPAQDDAGKTLMSNKLNNKCSSNYSDLHDVTFTPTKEDSEKSEAEATRYLEEPDIEDYPNSTIHDERGKACESKQEGNEHAPGHDPHRLIPSTNEPPQEEKPPVGVAFKPTREDSVESEADEATRYLEEPDTETQETIVEIPKQTLEDVGEENLSSSESKNMLPDIDTNTEDVNTSSPSVRGQDDVPVQDDVGKMVMSNNLSGQPSSSSNDLHDDAFKSTREDSVKSEADVEEPDIEDYPNNTINDERGKACESKQEGNEQAPGHDPHRLIPSTNEPPQEEKPPVGVAFKPTREDSVESEADEATRYLEEPDTETQGTEHIDKISKKTLENVGEENLPSSESKHMLPDIDDTNAEYVNTSSLSVRDQDDVSVQDDVGKKVMSNNLSDQSSSSSSDLYDVAFKPTREDSVKSEADEATRYLEEPDIEDYPNSTIHDERGKACESKPEGNDLPAHDPHRLIPSTNEPPQQAKQPDGVGISSSAKTAQLPAKKISKEEQYVYDAKASENETIERLTTVKQDGDQISRCKPRPFGSNGRETQYSLKCILDAEENKEVEFKSFAGEQENKVPWKMMEKAKKFICGCLNSAERKQGVIYFGVADGEGERSEYRRGEVHGLNVEASMDDIGKAFQAVLDDHLRSDDGPMQKGGEQQCVRLEFVPVTQDGHQTNLYVVEIEVLRDWNVCKDKTYYSKKWIEKRAQKFEQRSPDKKGLSEFYKVHKDEFDDVVVRTNGASQSINHIDVQKQLKYPLMAKYKEWKRQNKTGWPGFPSDLQPDDTDMQKINGVVRERLRNLNSKEFDYILIANKLPSEYRGTPHLSFLQNIPWVAVFDLFDPCSKKDGLHYVCNETTDAPRAINKTLEDVKLTESNWASGKEFSLSIRGTTWISRHDTMHDKEWIKSSKDCLYRTLSAYKAHSLPGRLICVFLGLGVNAIPEMTDVIESCFSILGETASKCISILCENREVADLIIKESKQALKHEIRDCTTAGIPWSFLKENVRDMIGPSRFKDRHAKTELPYFAGTFREVLNKKIYSLNDLEVFCPKPTLSSNMKDIEKARDTFYKGGQIEQMNLLHCHDIRRTQEREVCLKVERALKAIGQHSADVKTVALPYEAGSGATTLCRRILWEKRKDYRCAVVKALTTTTDFQINEFQRIAYDDKSISHAAPVLVIVDNVSEGELGRLSDNLRKRQTKCAIISTFPVSKSREDIGFDITPLRQLDEKETDLVKNILITITKDEEVRKGAEAVLEREKRFIWFGLELFGRDYLKIEEKLKNHIDSILTQNFRDGSEEVYETVLNSCCLLYYYSDSRTIFPHPILIDYLYGVRGDKDDVCNLMMDEIHDRFGGLLIEDFNETHGYHGWRPAHSLVGEVVKDRMDLETTAQLLLEKIGTGHSHTKKYLTQEIVQVFLQRRKISETIVVQEMKAGASPGSNLEFDVFGFSGVRTRYSPLIIDIMDGDGGINAALRLFIRLCEKVTEVEAKAYSWQQLARFIGYEFGIANIDNNNEAIFKRMHSAMKEVLGDEHLAVPKTGVEAAHKAIDVAIEYQPSFSNHYVTKGNLYLLELKDRFKDQVSWIDSNSLAESIKICKQAFSVYDKAEANARDQLSHYSVIGKIQVIISSLEIMKKIPCFHQDSNFTRYLNKEVIPQEIKELLTEADNEYIQSFRTTALELFNQIFREMRLRRITTREENEIQALDDVGVRVAKLRRTFYQVTCLDRNSISEIRVDQTSLNAGTAAIYQQVVEDILFKKDETAYSPWAHMSSTDISTLYNLLKDFCRNGLGSHDSMLICCKACFRLTEKPPISELISVVTKWVQRYPNSEWAHFYNYMLHFPSPNGSLATNRHIARESSKTCVRLVRERTGRDSRKSGAEYFLGKGIGLHSFVGASDLPSRKSDKDKTDFWRSQENFSKLQRVCGQKDVNYRGMVDYQGILIHFDDQRYPKQSKDDLWFYLGFTVAGPYAFDPLDQDDYEDMKTRMETRMQERKPLQERAGPAENRAMYAGFGRGKRREQCDKKPGILGNHKTSASNSGDPNLLQSTLSRETIGASISTWTSASTSQLQLSEEHLHAATRFNRVSSSNSLQGDYVPLSASLDTIRKPVSYAHAVQAGVPHEPPEKSSRTHSFSYSKISTCKTVLGNQCGKKRVFKPKYIDREGKLHHGVRVMGAEKSQECRRHIDERHEVCQTSSCTYAHSWRGDTIQWVCTKCTQNMKKACYNREAHRDFIWNLGPFYDGEGKIWKQTSGQQ